MGENTEIDHTQPIVDIPMVRVLDEGGREVLRGWYVMHLNRQPCVIGDWYHEEDVDHLVLHSRSADWNMSRGLIPSKITPPHTIEIIEQTKPKCYNLWGNEGFKCSKCGAQTAHDFVMTSRYHEGVFSDTTHDFGYCPHCGAKVMR